MGASRQVGLESLPSERVTQEERDTTHTHMPLNLQPTMRPAESRRATSVRVYGAEQQYDTVRAEAEAASSSPSRCAQSATRKGKSVGRGENRAEGPSRLTLYLGLRLDACARNLPAPVANLTVSRSHLPASPSSLSCPSLGGTVSPPHPPSGVGSCTLRVDSRPLRPLLAAPLGVNASAYRLRVHGGVGQGRPGRECPR